MFWVGLTLLCIGMLIGGYRNGWDDARRKVPLEHRPKMSPGWMLVAQPTLLFTGALLLSQNR